MAFLNALQAKAQTIDNSLKASQPISRQSEPVKQPEPKPVGPEVTIEINDTKNRIDIFFSAKPSELILNKLRCAGWHFRPTDKAWYHFDSDEHREFIRDNFNVELDNRSPEIVTRSEPAVTPALPEPATPSDSSDGEPYSTYKRQIAELLAALKIDCADLQLLAIDTLHRKTFPRN